MRSEVAGLALLFNVTKVLYHLVAEQVYFWLRSHHNNRGDTFPCTGTFMLLEAHSK